MLMLLLLLVVVVFLTLLHQGGGRIRCHMRERGRIKLLKLERSCNNWNDQNNAVIRAVIEIRNELFSFIFFLPAKKCFL